MGYYREVKKVLKLDVLIPPDVALEYNFSDEQLADIDMLVPHFQKRARRQRTADGKRKKKGLNRRQMAINNLPDVDAGAPPLVVPLSSTLEDRWWPKLGLWSITTPNPNSWASAVAYVTNTSSDDFLCCFKKR